MNENNKKINTQFSSSFRWNIAGSLFYETLKVLHQFVLFRIMARSVYGLMGSIFGIIYFIIYLSKLGIGESLPAYIDTFTRSKQNFNKLFIRHYLLPQVGFFAIGATIATGLYFNSFLNSPDSPSAIVIPLIIIFEGTRIFLRRFLHTVFINKTTVIAENILMTLFLLSIWIPYTVYGVTISTNLIFVPYLLDSTFALLIFVVILKKYYNKLPDKELSVEKDFWPRVIKSRFFNYSIQFGKNFYTGNFLVPLFAATFGLQDAGVFNLANHIAEAIKSTMKVTVIFSGGALLAKLKSTSLKIKRQAFRLLCEKLNLILYPVSIFLFFSYSKIHNASDALLNLPIQTILIMLLITFMEYFFLAYEQFYIVEEKTGKLFLFKILEFSMFYTIIFINGLSSPKQTLLGIILVRLISFSMMAISAYRTWQIKPNFNIKSRHLVSSIFLALLLYFILF